MAAAPSTARAEPPHLVRVPLDELRAVAAALPGEHERDEMAVPSYCHPNPLIRRLFWNRLHVALALLGPVAGQRVWDFGTGTGVMLPTLAAAADRVVASDLWPEPARALVEGRGLRNVTVFGGAMPTLDDVARESVDAIVALDVLEHVEDLPGVVAAFRERVRPDGRVIVSGPTESVVYRIGRVAAGFAGKGEYHHTNIFHIRDVFLANGFALRGERRLFAPPLPRLFCLYRFEPV